MSQPPKKSKPKHEFVLWSVRLTDDETAELLELGQLLYKFRKIKHLNKYNITRFALALLKEKLSAQVERLKATTSSESEG
jgi:hypothetical protein